MSAQYCPGQDGMKHLCGKNRPAQAGIPFAETGIPATRRLFPIMLVKLAYYAPSNAGFFPKNYAKVIDIIRLKLCSFLKIMPLWFKKMLGFI